MNAESIVRTLRENAEWCDANEYEVPLCMGDNQRAAADLIESLQAQLASSEIPCCECGGEVVEFTVPNDIWNSVMRPDGHETDREYLCLDCWHKALRQWMHGMQRREKAAVEDMTAMANGMRQDAEIDEVCCFACKHNEMYEETHFCNGCEREDCFEWRGPRKECGKC